MAKGFARLSAFCSLFFSLHVFAYSFTQDFNDGFYWASFPVDFVATDSNSMIQQALQTISNQAMNSWESAIGMQIWNLTSATNIIRWSDNISAETGFDASSTLAVTIRYIGGPYVAKSEILLNKQMSILQDPVVLQSVLVHELGHTIGLDHSFYGTIMAASYSMGNNSLHNDDIDGALAVIDEAQRRQATGYISPLTTNQQKNRIQVPTCGSITLDRSGPSQGPWNGLLNGVLSSLVIGLFLSLLFSPRKIRLTVGY